MLKWLNIDCLNDLFDLVNYFPYITFLLFSSILHVNFFPTLVVTSYKMFVYFRHFHPIFFTLNKVRVEGRLNRVHCDYHTPVSVGIVKHSLPYRDCYYYDPH